MRSDPSPPLRERLATRRSKAARAELRKLTAKTGKHMALLVKGDDARLFVPLELG